MTDGQDPTRLLHDPSVDESLRQTLRQAASYTPPIDAAAGLARLEGAIASGAGGATAGGMGGGALAAGAVAVALIGGGIWYASQPSEPVMPETATEVTFAPPAETPSLAEASSLAEIRSVTDSAADAPPVAPPALEPPVPEAPRAADDQGERAPRAREPAASDERGAVHEPAPSDESALRREMARISEARRALGTDPARTLALVDESRRELPRSVLAQERDALRILALAALGRDAEAAPLAQRFLQAHPSSPFAERIRRAIATP